MIKLSVTCIKEADLTSKIETAKRIYGLASKDENTVMEDNIVTYAEFNLPDPINKVKHDDSCS